MKTPSLTSFSTEIGHEKAQSVIDSITSSYAAEGQQGANPMLHPPGGAGGGVGVGPMGPGPMMGPGGGGPPPPMGMGMGMGMPGPGGMMPPPFGFPGEFVFFNHS